MGATAGGTGGIMAAIISKRRRRVIRAFAEAGATSPETAKTPEELKLHGSLIVQAQQLRGVLVEVEGGRYYLDEDRERVVASLRRRLVLLLLLAAVIIYWLVTYAGRG